MKNFSDLLPVTVWSLVLPALTFPLIYGALRLSPSITFKTGDTTLEYLLGILLMSVVMIVVHEGLHGLVFWITTREAPQFAFRWYYASTSAGNWYLPRRPFMIATLLPLVLITVVGVVLIPFVGPWLRFLLILLVVFNASGASGDLLVALRMRKLSRDVLAHDSGAEVTFYIPGNPVA